MNFAYAIRIFLFVVFGELKHVKGIIIASVDHYLTQYTVTILIHVGYTRLFLRSN